MYITNLDEAVPAIRARLRTYLEKKLNIEPGVKKFRCFAHSDHDPSMHFNPKNGDTTVRCFSCGWTGDIFDAASIIEGMPTGTAEWVQTTIPHLAEMLEIPISLGEPSPLEREKAKLYKLAQDIADILEYKNENEKYLEQRGWKCDGLTIGSISEEELLYKLTEKGWSSVDLQTSNMIQSRRAHFFGDDKLTFVIKDFRGRPVGFISRNLHNDAIKYINTAETLIYEKGKTLMGLDVALKYAKTAGIYVVEGPGDLAQLYKHGVFNAVAVCGTAFTADHLNQLKMLGISKIYFCLDWDDAGISNTRRILGEQLKKSPGVSCFVVDQPVTEILSPKDGIVLDDVDALLAYHDNINVFTELEVIPAFNWMLEHMSDNLTAEDICNEMVPIIASELTAVRREMLIKNLAEHTEISQHAITSDVELLRNGKFEERAGRLKAAAQRYMNDLEVDPTNIQSLLAEHERHIQYIEQQYDRDIIGVNYQLSRFDAIQEQRGEATGDATFASFKMNTYTEFAEKMGGGMPWTTGSLIYVGGRANSGKTAVVIALGLDIAMSDPDAIVLFHFTDDSYEQIEPRMRANLARMTNRGGAARLTIGMAANPLLNIHNNSQWALYNQANLKFRELLAEEKIIIIDSTDGNNLSALEKNLRYVRQRYPTKKLLVICDNTHNYMDFMNLDQRARMTRISDIQKQFTAKYHCCMIATAEYRKQESHNHGNIVLPIDDDLADARALTYRPNMIIHVYNDLHDRQEAADIFWVDASDPEERLPRLMLVFSKNKLSGFKNKLVMDLDPKTVTLTQYDADIARMESATFKNQRANGEVTVRGSVIITADEYEDREQGEVEDF